MSKKKFFEYDAWCRERLKGPSEVDSSDKLARGVGWRGRGRGEEQEGVLPSIYFHFLSLYPSFSYNTPTFCCPI